MRGRPSARPSWLLNTSTPQCREPAAIQSAKRVRMRVSSHQTGADEQRLFHLVESIVQEIHSALFPKNPHTWHEHLVKKLKLLVDGNATADQRLWWSIRQFPDNDHKKAAEDVASGVGYL